MSPCSTGLSDEERKTLGASSKSNAQDDIEPLVVKPRVAWRLLGCSNTYGYELLGAGELESYKDGKSRKITMASIKARIARQLEAAKAVADVVGPINPRHVKGTRVVDAAAKKIRP
jgi:excisionase family DNA binding protein